VVAASNAEAARVWDGETGDYWAAHADHYDAGVAAYREAFLAAAAVGSRERVLDVGCGTGQTTRDAAVRGRSALGVDLSTRMLAVARERAARDGVDGAEFRRADAQVDDLGTGFDLVVSRTGTMFFGDPPAAFANLARALRPGGRLVMMVRQPFDRQEWVRSFLDALAPGGPRPGPDAPGPFSLGDPDRVRALLTGAGFTRVEFAGREERMWFGADADEAARFIGGQFAGLLARQDGDGRRVAVDRLRADMAAHVGSGGVTHRSAAWFVSARRPGA
jgi:SAM-dependent methyltransferase